MDPNTDPVDAAMRSAAGRYATGSQEPAGDPVAAAMLAASQGNGTAVTKATTDPGHFSLTQAVATMTGGTLGSIVGGYRGLYDLATSKGSETASADVRAAQDRFTPATNQATSEALASPKNPLTWIPRLGKAAGETAGDIGAPPAVSTAIETGVNALPLVAGYAVSKLGGVSAASDVSAEGAAAQAAQAEAKDVGTTLSRGQATGDAMQYAHEITQAKVAGGEPYAELFKQQNSDMLNHIDNTLGAKTAMAPADAGQSALTRLAQIDQQIDAAKNTAYNLVRDSQGRSATLDAEHFYMNAQSALERDNVSQFVPDKIGKIYEYLAEGRTPFTVDTMTSTDKVLSRAQRTLSDGNETHAIGLIRSALNDTPVSTAEGQQAMQAYATAKGIARQQFQLADPSSQSYVPGYAAMLKGMGDADHKTFMAALENGTANVDPAKWFSQNVMKATPAAAKKLTGLFNAGNASDEVGNLSQGALSAIRDQVVKGTDVRASVSADSLNKVLESRPTLEQFMPSETLDSIQKLANTATRIEKQPFRSGVGTSNTGTVIQNLKDVAAAGTRAAIGHIPGGNIAIGVKDFVSGAMGRNATRLKAMSDVNPDFTQPPEMPPTLLQKTTGNVPLATLVGSQSNRP